MADRHATPPSCRATGLIFHFQSDFLLQLGAVANSGSAVQFSHELHLGRVVEEANHRDAIVDRYSAESSIAEYV